MAKIVLLGPRPALAPVLSELGIRGRVAFVNAGYQDREADDAALVASIGLPATNLRLHARAVEVFEGDPEFTAAYHARQHRFRNIQSFYRVRLEKTDEAARMISVRYVEPDLLEQEDHMSVAQLRQLDDDHLQRCIALRAAFQERWQPAERPIIARHRAQIAAELESAEALLVAGGHVALLLNRLKMFDVLGLAKRKPVIAWSAGAMVLTDRIVLFHDFPPYGSDIAQVLEAGLGLAPGIVVLPDPVRRIRIDDTVSIARFARRMQPATCVAMDNTACIVFEDGKRIVASAARLQETGTINPVWTGAEA